MKVLGERNNYRLDERSGDGYLYVSAIEKGVQVMLRGYARTSSDHFTFGLSPDEASQLTVVADALMPLVPTLEEARRLHETEQQRRLDFYRKELPDQPTPDAEPFDAKAPVVHEIVFEEGNEKAAEFMGGSLEPEELVVVGGLTWAREQLLLRFDKVDAMVFRSEAFTELAAIGANQPEFPPATSIWDRTK